MDVRAVLADVAALGPYFAVGAGLEPGDRPVADLYSDPGPLSARIAHVRSALDCDERVAASLAFQGLAAQLGAAPYAAAVLHGTVPALTPGVLHWRRGDDGGWRLGCDPSGVGFVHPEELAALLAGLLVPLVAAVRGQASIAERLLWGNAASTIAAAKRVLATQRPAAAARAAEVARAVLGSGSLAGAGELLAPHAPDRHWSFRRSSCCLYYRVRGGGLCEDCVLSPPLRCV
jgi:FhuF-like iron-sulfur protein